MSKKKPIFIVDAMLGKLAKKLRLLGYDSFYSSNIEDDNLLQIAKNENRIIISKDEQLIKKAKKFQIENIQITKNEEIEQLIQINEKIDLGKCIIQSNNTRCPVCNGVLIPTEKNTILEHVPLGVFKNMNNFWVCNKCKKIYWEGTHIKNLQKFNAELNARLS
ncbi:MAG TPA: Mut7-C RNAse domain-containing protein [Nitrosopumilaceae archaeon]|nr:Mut7-C RNAse domain-containing protein [Nitrosopumilaceae archaeon]